MPAVVLALLITVGFGTAASSHQPQTADDTTLMGRLATVEPRARRISVVADDSAERLELLVAEDVEILLDGKELTLADLVIQVGSRVKVRHGTEAGVRVANSITVGAPRG